MDSFLEKIKQSAVPYLGLMMIMAVVLSALNIHKGHNWGGDFSLYIHQAMSIAENNTSELFEANKYAMDHSDFALGPYLYPFGFPVLLYSLYDMEKLDFKAMKWLGIGCFVLSLPLFYLLFRHLLLGKWTALVATYMIAINWNYLIITDSILSDLPFFFFSVLALLFFYLQKNYINQLFLGLVIFYAYFIRDNGIFLLPALLCFQATDNTIRNRPKLFLALPYLVFGIMLVVLKRLFPYNGGTSNLETLMHLSPSVILYNLVYYTKYILNYFLAFSAKWILILSPLVVWLLLRGVSWDFKKYGFIYLYLLLNLGLFMVWPYNEGYRFIFPLLPFFVWMFIRGALKEVRNSSMLLECITWRHLVFSYLSIYTAFNLYEITRRSYTVDTNKAFSHSSLQMYEYLKKNVDKNALISFIKPRVLRLGTGINAIYTSPDNFGKSPADYLLAHLTEEEMENLSRKLTLLQNFDDFDLYKRAEVECESP